MPIITMSYGGLGNGTAFDMQYPIQLGMHAGEAIDALILNGNEYGGPGGGMGPATQIIKLGLNDYWGGFRIAYSNGTTTGFIIGLGFYANSGVSTVGGGGFNDNAYAKDYKQEIRILRIGGKSINRNLTVLSVEFVDDYKQSVVVEQQPQTAVIDFIAGPASYSTYNEEKDQIAQVYQSITTRVETTSFNASAQGEYYAQFAVNTGMINTETSTTDIKKQTETQLDSIVAEQDQVTSGMVAMLCCTIQILKDSDGNVWYYPTGNGRFYLKLDPSEFSRLVGYYDLTNVLHTQLGMNYQIKNGLHVLTSPSRFGKGF